jgi:hypothetical protein
MSTPTRRARLPLLGVLVGAVIAVCLLPAAASAASLSDYPTPNVALAFSVADSPDAAPRTAALVCRGAGAYGTGYLAETPTEACLQVRRVAAFLVNGPAPGRLCTDIFGGPQTAQVRGLVGGRWIHRSLSRRDGCEVADWDAMGVLLASGISPQRRLVEYRRTGGFAGFDDRLAVSYGGLAVYTPRTGVPRVFKVSPGDLTDLNDALDAADFPSLDPEILPDFPVADGFTYTLAHSGKTIVTADGAVPDALQPAIGVLNRLLVP